MQSFLFELIFIWELLKSLSQEFLEHQMKEISFLKQQLNLYENSNLECNRKWQGLIEVKRKKKNIELNI